MKKKRLLFSGALVLALIFGLVLTACDDDSGYNPYSTSTGTIGGTWAGNVSGYPVSLIITSVTSTTGTWSAATVGNYESGTYTMTGSTTATLYSDMGYSSASIGTATLLNATTLRVALTGSYNIPAGVYTFTRTG